MSAGQTIDRFGEHELRARLRAAGQRVTPQRLAILRVLGELDRHVTADELRAALEATLPGVSLPTIYATLELFERLGLVRRVAAGDSLLYDPRGDEHQHLICRSCGAVEDLEVSLDAREALAAARDHGFAPDRAELVVSGTCSACRRTA